MVADSGVTPDGTSLYLTYTPFATCILIAGYLGMSVIQRFDAILKTLPTESGPPVLVRICSTGLEFGVSEALRHVLAMRRALGLTLAVWADEPLVRRIIPMSLLHATPPYGPATWDDALPPP